VSKTYWEAVKGRRSLYGFGDEEIVSKQRIEEIVSDALWHTPSAFNSQSTRIVLLFDAHSKRFWELALKALQDASGNKMNKTKRKIEEEFVSGYGTVLFFEDQAVVDGLMREFPLYADKFPVYAQHTNAMHQFVIWAGLEAEGLGASLQHYNPVVDEAVRREWDLPESWKLVAQMPFGTPLAAPGEKEHEPLEARLKVFK